MSDLARKAVDLGFSAVQRFDLQVDPDKAIAFVPYGGLGEEAFGQQAPIRETGRLQVQVRGMPYNAEEPSTRAYRLWKALHLQGFTVIASTVIELSSVASPTVIDCGLAPHDLVSGESVVIAGHTGSTPDINGSRVVTVLDEFTFSIPVAVTVAGANGTVAQVVGRRYHIVRPLSMPAWLKRDEKKRHVYAFSVEAFKNTE